MRLQKTELFWNGDVPTVYIDIVDTEDAYESEISYLDHIREGGDGSMTFGTFLGD
jgi:hypothetical protein